MEFTLLFAALTAVGAAWIATRLLGRRLAGMGRPTDLLIGSAAVGLFAGRLVAMIQAGVNPITHPLDIIIVRAGVDTATAGTVAVLALAWSVREHVPAWLDVLAPAAVAGLAGWHGGCVWRGACLGTASDLPWALALPGSDVTRHPVELYAAGALVAVAFATARLPARPWLATGFAMAGSAAIRLLTEPLRPSLTGGPVWFYASALILGATLMAVGPRLPAVSEPSELDDHPTT